MKLLHTRVPFMVNGKEVNGVYRYSHFNMLIVVDVTPDHVLVEKYVDQPTDSEVISVPHDGIQFTVDDVKYLLEDIDSEYYTIAGPNAGKFLEVIKQFM